MQDNVIENTFIGSWVEELTAYTQQDASHRGNKQNIYNSVSR